MCKATHRRYFETIYGFQDKGYIYSVLFYNIAPILTKDKESVLLTFSKNSKRDLYSIWEKYRNDIEKQFDLDFFQLRKTDKTYNILFYNKEKLKKTLSKKRNKRFLERFGYNGLTDVKDYLRILSNRYERACPHEIGIFLGYPLDDVVEFIDCPNKECLFTGYWKVYNNEDVARQIFDHYDSIKEKTMNFIMDGHDWHMIYDYLDKKILSSI